VAVITLIGGSQDVGGHRHGDAAETDDRHGGDHQAAGGIEGPLRRASIGSWDFRRTNREWPIALYPFAGVARSLSSEGNAIVMRNAAPELEGSIAMLAPTCLTNMVTSRVPMLRGFRRS
jgi:hypothetical protein